MATENPVLNFSCLVSEDNVKKMNAEINNLKLSLKASEDALLAEWHLKVKDRKLYDKKTARPGTSTTR